MNKWKKLKAWNVANPDGSIESYTLSEHNETGDYRIENDFGNIIIDMERMSGYEFLKRAVKEIESTMMGDDNDATWFDNIFDNDCDNDDSSTGGLDCDHTD